MGRKYTYLLPTIIAAALALGIFVGGKLHFNDTPERLFTTNSKKDKLNRLIDFIDYEYVDEVNTDSIVDVTVNSILEKLDPHSVYIPERDMTRVTENMKGDFVGIGINFYTYQDTIAVIRTVPGGPSDKVGLLPGDRILMAGPDTLYGKGMPSAVIVDKLKGKEGTPVPLTVYRKTANKTFAVTVKRGVVPIKSVTAAYLLKPDMGYIKINRFAESTFVEFKQALAELMEKGAKKLVLDLRDNPGGYLGVAEQMADEFLGEGKLILFTKNKRGKIDKTYATKKGSFENRPVYVLINERSASASEIIAGALQDNDVGTIVGRRSFGKGLVQREMALGDGSAVRLTVSRYYTPTGRSIQRTYANGTKDYYERFTERYHSGELISVDSIKVADSLKFTTPNGKVVYGGGGIVPDVFVPIGSNEEEAVASMESLGFLSFFVFEHLESDRTRYMAYSQTEFLDDFNVDDILFSQFVEYSAARDLRMNFYDHEETIKRYIKAALAEQLFNDNVGAHIRSSEDPMLQEVLRLDSPMIKEAAPLGIEPNG